jgi:hypothetical protein
MPVAYAGKAPPLKHSAKARPAKVRPSVALRLRVRWNAAQLDAALADGADPAASKPLALRAQQLADPKHRARIARSIDHLLELTERGTAPQLSLTRAPFQPGRVEHSRPQLMELADRLEAVDSPPVKGLAMANLLVEDGTPALYDAHAPSDPLRPVVEAILAAFDR